MTILICDHLHCAKAIVLCCHFCEEKDKGCKGCGLPEFCQSQKVYDSMEQYEERSKLMCFNCDEVLGKDDVREAPDGERYCEECFQEHFTSCDSCGEVINNDDVWCAEDDDASYCSECYHDSYGNCNDCGNDYPNEDLHRTSGDRYICNNCGDEYTSCNECGVYIEEDNLHETKEGVPYCGDCASEHLSRCEKCASWIHNDDIPERTDEHIYCEECTEAIEKERIEEERKKELFEIEEERKKELLERTA